MARSPDDSILLHAQDRPHVDAGVRVSAALSDLASSGWRHVARPAFQFAHPPTTGSGSSEADRKSTRLNSSHVATSYAVFCLKTKPAITSPRTLARRVPTSG